MESWKTVWRDGFQPGLSTRGLEALLHGLQTDSRELVQGATTSPPPLQCVQDFPCEAADAIGYCGWKGEDLVSVSEVEEAFAKTCFEADQRMGEPAAVRWFLNFWDDTPRPALFREVVAEIERELARRRAEHLPEDLQRAVKQFPDDLALRMAVTDYLIEHGG